MMWPEVQSVAQSVAGRFLNSLPAGMLIAAFAWGLLRLLPRQNSGTRFAVWLIALLAIAGMPLLGGIGSEHAWPVTGTVRPLFTVGGRWGLLLFLVWFVAALTAVVRLAAGLWNLRALRRSCRAIETAQLDPAVRTSVAAFRLSRPATLATSGNVSVPAAIGFFRPMIVLPEWTLRELPPEELKIVLLHEFAHLRRWDDWTNLLQKLVRAVFVLHPAVWWIDRRLSLEREMACDDRVLAETSNPRGYAQCLIGLLERSAARRGWSMAQAVVHRAGEASLRLARILDVDRPATRILSKPALAAAGTFALACLAIAPQAPRIVGFESGTAAVQMAQARPAMHAQSPASAPVVVPAALRTVSSASPRKQAQRPTTRNSRPLRPEPAITPPVVAAGWTPDDESNTAEALETDPKQSLVPTEALLIIRTTQRVGPNSWVWRVNVWRVRYVNLPPDSTEKVPAPRKT